MQERVSPQMSEAPELIVQYSGDLGSVGVGLEYTSKDSVPGVHGIVDVLYGDVPTQTKIGRLFHDRINELGWDMHVFLDSDSEAEFENKLGRVILDSVTGSRSGGDSLWTWFDRPSVNRLIRLLRNARDKTFGRDE